MILPAALLMALLIVYPLVAGICYSFTDYTVMGNKETQFVGLRNYIEMFTTDTDYLSVLGFTFMLAFCSTLLAYVCGLGIALLLNAPMKGRGIFRSLMLMPWIISMAVTAQNWKWLLNDRYGIINHVLMSLNLIEKPLIFLGNLDLVRPTVIVISAWKSLPFMIIIILAALQGVPRDQYESAAIDGASRWQSFRYITMPSIKNVSVMCTMLMFIWSFNAYESIALLTGGGPGKYTNTLAVYTYKMAFHSNRLGYASAISVVVMILLVAFALIRQRLSRED
uniref:Putative ATPbinding transport protein n=1 Tax=termite gut metagenome TaxID=433724 RepID=S0DF86_9ZZZZ